jgi:hypothetical protein
VKVRRQLPVLCEGGFVERAENVLAFGLPGRGKTHLVAAIGYELVNRGYRVLVTLAYALVQQLLVAKRDLTLKKTLARLARGAPVAGVGMGKWSCRRWGDIVDVGEAYARLLAGAHARAIAAATSDSPALNPSRLCTLPLAAPIARSISPLTSNSRAST